MGSIVQVLAILTFKATALVAFAYVLVLAMRKRPAASRHMVWSLTAAGLLLLPLLSVGLPKWRVAVLPEYSLAVLARPSSAGVPAVTKAAQPPDQRPADGDSRAVKALPVLKSWSLERWVLFLWMGGAGVVLLKLLVGAARIRRWTRQAVAVDDTAWAKMAGDLGRQLGLRSPVRLRESEAAMMPMALGLFRPTILLPRDANSWPEQRVRLVLLHELAHVKRWDCLMQLVTQAACAVYWFHPLVWLAARESTKERERACDDMVLTEEPAAPDYAQHLLEVARSMRAVRFAWSAVSMARRSQLEGRLLAILDGGHLRHSLSRNAVFGLAIAAAVLLLPLAAFVPQRAGAASQAGTGLLSQADQLCLEEQLTQAGEMYEKALEEAESSQASKGEQTAIRERLVSLWLSQDEFGQALNLADSYEKRGAYPVAESIYRRALAWRELKSGVMHPEIAGSVERLAVLLRKTGKTSQAEMLERRLQQIQRTAAVRLGPELSPVWRRSETEFRAGDDYAKAEAFFQQSLTTRVPLLGAEDPEVATTLERIGYFQAKQDRKTEAEAAYQRALAIKTHWLGADHADVATTMELYAELLAGGPRRAEAERLNEQSKQIRVARTQQLWGGSPSPSAEKAGGAVQSPRLRVKAEPEYTEAARIAKREGTAVFRVEVAPDGRIHNAETVRSAGMGLDEMASAALLKWRFQPGTKDGQPVLVQATIEVNFRLQ